MVTVKTEPVDQDPILSTESQSKQIKVEPVFIKTEPEPDHQDVKPTNGLQKKNKKQQQDEEHAKMHIICTKCDKKFARKKDLNQHNKDKHPTTKDLVEKRLKAEKKKLRAEKNKLNVEKKLKDEKKLKAEKKKLKAEKKKLKAEKAQRRLLRHQGVMDGSLIAEKAQRRLHRHQGVMDGSLCPRIGCYFTSLNQQEQQIHSSYHNVWDMGHIQIASIQAQIAEAAQHLSLFHEY